MIRQRAMLESEPDYLRPYVRAALRHGGGFESLLWSSPQTQEARFDALVRAIDMRGMKVLDAGCGRADLLVYLTSRDIFPAAYVGVEAVTELLWIAEATAEGYADARIVNADFVSRPACLRGADVTVFCGSLNTLDACAFETTLRRAMAAASVGVAFNFLSSPGRACASHLTWHRPEDVMRLARSISRSIRVVDDYLDGDCTMAIFKDGR